MRATALGGVPALKAADVYSLDPVRGERGERRPDSSSCAPLLLGRGAVAHTRAHALHSSSCCFPSPQPSAAPPVLVPHYLPGISLLVCSSVSSSVCQCPVPMCLPARAALSVCLALSKGSGCPGLPAHPRPSVFLCSVTLCLSLGPPSSACLCLCLHLPALALFIPVNRTGTCIQTPCAQAGWSCAGSEPRQRTGKRRRDGGREGEGKGYWKRPGGQPSFLLPLHCSHGKDPQISLLTVIMT